MKKSLLKLHLLLSLPVGIFISIICLTGSIMVFDDEILEHVNRSTYYCNPTSSGVKMPLEEMRLSVNAQLCTDSISGVTIFTDPNRTIRFTLSSGRRNYVFVDPYSGVITGFYNAQKGFFWKVQQIHRWLLDTSKSIGKTTTGISTLFLIFIVITGIAVWWPKNKRQTISGLTIKKNAATKRRIIDLHRVLGIYSSALLLLAASTGLMWSFKWYNNCVMTLFGIKTEERQETKVKITEFSATEAQWSNAIDEAIETEPHYQYISVNNKLEVTILPKSAPHERATNTYVYEPKSDELKNKYMYGKTKNRSYIMTWAYALHVGSWGGWFSKLLTFVMGIIGTSLPLTGYWLYYSKLKRK